MDAYKVCDAKIVRAEEHLLPLLDDIRTFLSGKPYGIWEKGEPGSPRRSFEIRQFEDGEKRVVEWGIRLGECVHDLRSCLDQLTWALIERNSFPIAKGDELRIALPMGDNHADFMSQISIRYLTLDQIAVFQEAQPYHGGSFEGVLRHMNTLWNLDKHRLLQAIAITTDAQSASLRTENTQITLRRLKANVRLEDKADLGYVEIAPTGPDAHVYMESLPLEIAFGEGEISIESVRLFPQLARNILEKCWVFLGATP